MKIKVMDGLNGIATSSVDGPGVRSVIHTAGCSVGCAGCFNPHTHDGAAGEAVGVDALARALVAASLDAGGSGGVTVSGGEPTDQLEALEALLEALRGEGCPDVIMYSGRRIEALRKREGWQRIEAAGLVDVLIDGPFDQRQKEGPGGYVRGSKNQRVLCLTGRIPVSDMTRGAQVEIQIVDGRLTILGFPSVDLLAALG